MIIDTNNNVTGKISSLKADGVKTVIRYLTTNATGQKLVRPAEARALADAGINLALVFEIYGGVNNFEHNDITPASGAAHARFSRDYAPKVGAPNGVIIWFAIDTDVSVREYNVYVKPYLVAARAALGGQFKIGVYACGYACGRALDDGLVDATWLTQSMGWNGSRAFRDSRRWRLLQGPEKKLHGLSVDSNVANGDEYGQFLPFAAAGAPRPAESSSPVEPPATPPAASPAAPPTVPIIPAASVASDALNLLSLEKIARIVSAAATSQIINHRWKNGSSPRGYVKGSAVSFGNLYAKLLAGDPAAALAAQANTGDDDHDAISWYNSNFQALGMDNSAAGPDTLRHEAVMMLGLGMRESSGIYCEGRDRSANNETADTAEAGLFQASWDFHRASPLITKLFETYYPARFDGYLGIYKEGVSCSPRQLENYGTGRGRDFQALCKVCPDFAYETVAVGLRVIGGQRPHGHWGPIQRKEAELIPAADALFKQVQAIVSEG